MNELRSLPAKQYLLLLSVFLLVIHAVHSATIYQKTIQVTPETTFTSELSRRMQQHADNSVSELRSNEPSNVFFTDTSFSNKMSPNFENIPSQYIGPNYSLGKFNGNYIDHTSNKVSSMGIFNPSLSMSLSTSDKQQQSAPQKEDSMNDMLASTFKKYDVKKYLLKKIFGNSHDLDEDEGGFFSNKHLKRHGTAGVAAKVLGELIGIKIRESIEGLGKSFSEYAKDYTARNFVNLGQLFGRVFKAVQN